ncbi:MAG: hypothetical protein U0354_12875 [Candidatus Sericytochromatia bacterium]
MLVETLSGYLVETDESNFKTKNTDKKIDKKLEELIETNKDDTNKLINELKKLINENPTDLKVYTALDLIYNLNEMDNESIALTKDIFEKFPDELIGRLLYLNDLAVDKKFDQIKEICKGEITPESIIGKKCDLDLPEYEILAQILIFYYMNNSKEEEAKSYYNELKKFDCDIALIKHEFFPDFIDKLKQGDSVTIKDDYTDPETNLNLKGWQGRISDIDLEENLVFIEWDSLTLKSIKFEDIEKIDEQDLPWYASEVHAKHVELCEPRDTEEESEKVFEEINDKLIEKNKIPNFPYELYDEVTKIEVRLGRVLTDILATMQELRKSYSKYNLNKLADFIEIPISDLLKRMEDLEQKGFIKTYYSSVLKKDRERWIFLRSDENLALYNKLQNKEITPKELERLYEKV